MRAFVQDYVFNNILFLLVDYAFISMLILWRGQYNTRIKSESIQGEIMVFTWEKNYIWTHFGISLIFIVISMAFFAGDFGWFLDIFCWFGFLWGLLIYISFFFIDKTYILKDTLIVVPAFGRRKDYSYSSITGIDVKRDKVTKNGISKDTYKMTISTKDATTHDISDRTDKMQQLMRFLKEKVGGEKFKIIDESIKEEEASSSSTSD